MRKTLIIILILCANLAVAGGLTTNPIMFVTQYPSQSDFGSFATTFGNHHAGVENVPRGGDLYIRYADGTLRNLTREAGYGMVGFQGANAIAVRDPTIHWSGNKALFSMVVGSGEQQYQRPAVYWQMYEISGFQQGQTVVITKVANQPENYNNVTPIYDSQDNVIFTTDMPRTKNHFNYPQYDEYDNDGSTTGLWKLKRNSGTVTLMQHAPSGAFSPIIDKAGRVVFTRWDHLERDQQGYPNNTGQFNYASELPGAAASSSVAEVFPEPQEPGDPDVVGTINLYSINHFFPWQLNQDGTEEETLNHVGRHEFFNYMSGSFTNDSSVVDFNPYIGRLNSNVLRNAFMLDEDPNQAGRFIAIDAPEFETYNAGQILAFELPVGARPDLVSVTYLTHPDTRNSGSGINHSGFYRDAIVLSNGTLLSSHTPVTHSNNTPFEQPFTLKTLSSNGSYFVPNTAIANLPDVTISYWNPDSLVNYTGPLWQLQPVEVMARAVPPVTQLQLQSPELQVMNEENVDVSVFQSYLRSHNLAVVVMRDVTARDSRDTQQPFNLKVATSNHQTTGDNGQIYNLSHMQFVQADQIRGIGGANTPRPGQRVLAQYMHASNVMANNIPFVNAPAGSVKIYADGSVAAFVPTRRAMAWQSVAPDASAVVRERYWVSFQPGEIRACAGCHGINDVDQAGNPPSTQKAQAFRALLQHWKQNLFTDLIFKHGFEL